MAYSTVPIPKLIIIKKRVLFRLFIFLRSYPLLFALRMAWRETLKKPADKPAAPKPKFADKEDDWDTDLAYQVGLALSTTPPTPA